MNDGIVELRFHRAGWGNERDILFLRKDQSNPQRVLVKR